MWFDEDVKNIVIIVAQSFETDRVLLFVLLGVHQVYSPGVSHQTDSHHQRGQFALGVDEE